MITTPTSRKLIKLIDHMPHWYDSDRDFDPVCEKLFGATWLELSPDEEDEIRKEVNPIAAYTAKKCRELGYDIIIDGNVPVHDWEDFAVMIIAHSKGLLPTTQEARTKKQREVEAQELEREQAEEAASFERHLKQAVAEFAKTRR